MSYDPDYIVVDLPNGIIDLGRIMDWHVQSHNGELRCVDLVTGEREPCPAAVREEVDERIKALRREDDMTHVGSFEDDRIHVYGRDGILHCRNMDTFEFVPCPVYVYGDVLANYTKSARRRSTYQDNFEFEYKDGITLLYTKNQGWHCRDERGMYVGCPDDIDTNVYFTYDRDRKWRCRDRQTGRFIQCPDDLEPIVPEEEQWGPEVGVKYPARRRSQSWWRGWWGM